ncbi:putative outer membrane starch-binding protein [Dysgonomonas alginatilytica]|uniref:Putative outer membrane starch-binding protein n=1 Tax=Dysgonomonas alginatilytica TaxID=1605892 RepID=A0A2V3PVC4_9BACT|nr:RagB/SusD family nutrient uptake outer membrane protein [Dysgonomonas alginatilytica]PXV68754.1 putative outer membrane starch-binding protein [Dysgonomonas alginatilytica]
MKNILKYIFIFCLVFATGSCNDILDTNPIDEIGAGDFYKNTEDINQSVTACYNGMQITLKNEWYLTELRSDNTRSYANNSTAVTSKNVYAMDMFRVETTHPLNKEYWESVYHNIANCNTVLKYLDVVSDATTKDQFEGEALFIRAYHYFNLVRLYGPLFKVTERITIDEANKSERSSVEDIYALIENDLKTAVSKLPAGYPDLQKGRVDIWGAKALLAKVYLTLSRFDEAKVLLAEVKDNNKGYGLLPSYKDIFSISNEMNKEILFTVRYKAGGLGLGSPFASSFAPANSFDFVITAGGDGNNCPTESLLNSYEANDSRKDVTLAATWDNVGSTVYIAYPKKYLSQVATKYDAENDWPILRFADVLLMLGEVENELTGPSAGLPYLNQIRNRAGLPSLTTTEIPNKLSFRNAMEKERRVEFALENQRFFDLQRTNKLVSVMENHFETEEFRNANSGAIIAYYTNPSNESYLPDRKLHSWQLLLPIPFSVISVATNASQNPGY